MRLIVASATMDAKELFDFFNNNHIKDKSKDSAVILSVKGRQFPVNIYYTIGRVV
jgi:ATP-dependent RNA helicase DDX35